MIKSMRGKEGTLRFVQGRLISVMFASVSVPRVSKLRLVRVYKRRFPRVGFMVLSMCRGFDCTRATVHVNTLSCVSGVDFSPRRYKAVLRQIDTGCVQAYESKRTRRRGRRGIRRLGEE